MYRNIAGAIPKDTMSDSESMFFPNPYSSFLFIFLAIQPSLESNMIAIIIKIADRLKLLFIELIMDKNPELKFNKDTMSDSARKFIIFVSNFFIF